MNFVSPLFAAAQGGARHGYYSLLLSGMFSFCKPVSSKKRFLPHRRLDESFTFTLFEHASALPAEEWNSAHQGQAVFFDPRYLAILENCIHTRLQCRYVIVYKNARPCGVIYYQVVDFKAGLFGSLLSRQVENIATRRLNLFERYIDSNSEEVLLRLFTCGNNLVSGEYGFCFSKHVGAQQSHDLLVTITDLVAREEKLRGTISAILLKDYGKPLRPEKFFADAGYSRFSVEPNLVVDLPSGVKSLDAYVSLFSKKYRNRAKSIFRNLEGITVRDLELDDVRKEEKAIYALYSSVFEKAKFRLMQLPLLYFSAVKETFNDRFLLKGYYSGDRLVAFSSCFVMHDGSLEAHYIGFDYAENQRHDLYQNILFSMIAQGLRHGCSHVNLGRTAAEIKTTVGARPRELFCYIKPQNTISRLIQKPFISFLQPAPWTPRNPFKEETAPPQKNVNTP
jgi:hypothetical protein